LAESARAQYLEMTKAANFDPKRGIVADGIIQAGSYARNNGDIDHFRKHVERASQEMST